LAISYLGIVFACLWRGPLRWIGVPMAAAVALWPRPAAPVAWIASDGKDAAVVIAGEEVALKPRPAAIRHSAVGPAAWVHPADRSGRGSEGSFDCDRNGCAPIGATRPAIGAWWTKRKPSAERFDALCDRADIVILRTTAPPPAACSGAVVLTRAAFAAGGSAEVFAARQGWRIAWSQPVRGARPWTVNDIGG